MLRLTKKLEYSLIALKHMGTQVGETVSTVKEMAALYQIPQELLAKILQQLTRDGIICSVQGPKGGYRLSRLPAEINLSDLMKTIEGEPDFIECASGSGADCVRIEGCVIRSPMIQINHQMNQFFRQITLEDVMNGKIPGIETI